MAKNDGNTPINVMFVCFGNTCRSPMAQAVFQHLVRQRNLEARFGRIESCGTAASEGANPDKRTVTQCEKEGIHVSSLAQKLQPRYYTEFDYLIGMDKYNVQNIKAIQPKDATAEIRLFGDFGDGKAIADPYDGDQDGYATTYKQVLSYSEGLLNHLLEDVA